MKAQRFIGELIQWLIIALLAFVLFAWIEVRFCIPALERDVEEVIHHDTIYIVKGDTLTP